MNIAYKMQVRTSSINIYDRLIMLLISLQAFGLLGGFLRPVRVFAYCSILFVIIYFLNNRKKFIQYNYEFFFFAFWVIYAVISLTWVIDYGKAFLSIYQLMVSIFLFFTLIWLAGKANKPKESIIKGWILLFLLTLPIALYELTFDLHLPMSVQEEGETIGGILSRRFASVTFGNLNTYNLVLCYTLPFLLLAITRFTKKRQLFVNILLLVLLCYIVIINSSRAAILTVGVGLLLFLIYYLKKGKGRLLFVSIGLVVVFFVIKNFELIFLVTLYRFQSAGFEDSTRSILLLNAWDALKNSYLLGVGAGNMEASMASYGTRIVVLHNLFMEIALQYGVYVFCGFLIILWRIIWKGMMYPEIRWFILIAFCVLGISSVIDARYLPKDYIWLFLGSLSIVVDKRYAYE